MADPTQFYDELAAHYDLIFEDWEASILRQSAVFARILERECGDTQPLRVLDCACGIGTQSLGLAMKGFEVTGCDISPGAIQRASSEAAKRGLSVLYSVADMVRLSALPQSNFDAVICIDNSIPHLQTDKALLQAAREAYAKLKPGGALIVSIRDYDRLVKERPTSQEPKFYGYSDSRRMVFQIWDWLDERRYRFHLYITQNLGSEWQTFHYTTNYRAVLQHELQHIFEEAGFIDIRWWSPLESGFYQPILIAHRNQL